MVARVQRCERCPDELWRGVVKECIDNAVPFPVEGLVYPMAFLNKVLALYEHGRPKTLSTGFPSLDPYYKVRCGEWTLITGIPSHGKSLVFYKSCYAVRS